MHQTLAVTAVLCMPVLIAATAIGTAVAILQAATQVQEQTLTLLPKIIAAGAAIVLLGSYAMHLCAALLVHIVSRLPEIVGQ